MKRNCKLLRPIQSNKGTAALEALPLLAVFIVLVAYGIGAWGVVHTSILNSIAARNYAFETFRNRTNLNYFRENKQAASSKSVQHTVPRGNRYHGITAEDKVTEGSKAFPTARKIAFSSVSKERKSSLNIHQVQVHEDVIKGIRNQKVEVNPAWLMIGYGMCLNAQCGD